MTTYYSQVTNRGTDEVPASLTPYPTAPLSHRNFIREVPLVGRWSWWLGGCGLTCMPSWPETPIPMSATCIMLTSLAPSPSRGRRKHETRVRCKLQSPWLFKWTNWSFGVHPTFQSYRETSEAELNVASHYHLVKFPDSILSSNPSCCVS